MRGELSNLRIVIGQKSERVENCEMNGRNGLEVKIRSGGAISRYEQNPQLDVQKGMNECVTQSV